MFDLVLEHPLLSTKAKRLQVAALTEHVRLALDLLALADVEGVILGSASASKAARAVAVQVSYQVARGIGPDLYESVSVDSLSRNYKQGLVSDLAYALASSTRRDIGRPIPSEFRPIVQGLR